MSDWSGRIASGFGPDWLQRARAGEKGEVATFYSYKGGTGRSLALVNCAGLIAQHLPATSKPILLIDFDLEAPGLHRYLASYLSERLPTEREGVLELFDVLLRAVERELPSEADAGESPAARLDDEAAARVVESIDLQPYIIPTGLKSVSLLKSGRFDETYDQRLMNFRWEMLFDKAPALFRCFAERLTRDYSFVFVDSRTGLSDTTGVSTMLLPDVLVIVFTPNSQSLTGVEHLVRKAVDYRATSSDLRTLRVYPLPSRVDTQVEHFRRVWRMGQPNHPLFGDVLGYQPMFVQVFKDVFRLESGFETGLVDYFDVVQIPHSSDYAYGERLCFTSAASNDSLSIRGAYEQFLPWLVTGASPWQHPAKILAEQQAERFLLELGAQAIPETDSWPTWFERLSTVVGTRHEQYMTQSLELSDDQRANVNLALALALAYGGDLQRSAQLIERESASGGSEACYSALALATAHILEIWRQRLTPVAVATEERWLWLAAANRLFEVMKLGRALNAQWSTQRTHLFDHAPWLVLSLEALRLVRESDTTKLGKDQRIGMLRSIRNVALARKAEGDLAAAGLLGRQVLEICRRVLGQEHAETLAAQVDLAGTLRARGDVAGALLLEAKTRESRREAVDGVREGSQSARLFRIFVSSPGDVAEERQLVRKVAKQLAMSPLLRGRFRPEVVTWEESLVAVPTTRGDAPQALINRRPMAPRECDLTLLILWSRIGTPLPRDLGGSETVPEASGTLWEFQDAITAGRPVVVYRRTSKPQLDIDDPDFEAKRAQYQAVGRFFSEFEGLFRPYQSPSEFEQLLTRDLPALLASLDASADAAQTTAKPRDQVAGEMEERADDLEGRLVRSSATTSDPADFPHAVRQLRRAAILTILGAAQGPEPDPRAAVVVTALEAGDAAPAWELLGRIEDELIEAAGGQLHNVEERRSIAQLAREQGALAYNQDPTIALAACRRAAAYDPDDRSTHLLMGDLLARLGRLEEALTSSREAGRLAELHLGVDGTDTAARRDLSGSQELVGDILSARGDGAGALEAYRAGLAITEAVAALQPDNAEWQRDVAVRRQKIGDALAGQGDLVGALAAYRAGQASAEALAERDPANAAWQRDLSLSRTRVGVALEMYGDLSGALASYRGALVTAEALAARDPAHPLWQRDLSMSRQRIGDVLVAQGDLEGALAIYRSGVAIAEALATADPTDRGRRRELSLSLERVGDVLMAQGNLAEALEVFRAGMGIATEIAESDPANAEWQRDLSVSANKIGDVLAMQGQSASALAAYRTGLEIFETLTSRDPSNLEWQRDRSVSHDRIGDVLAAQGDSAGAIEAYRTGLKLHEELAARDPANTQWVTDVAMSWAKLGQLAEGQTKDARRRYLTLGREILVTLKSEGRLRPGHDLITWFDDQLAVLESA